MRRGWRFAVFFPPSLLCVMIFDAEFFGEREREKEEKREVFLQKKSLQNKTLSLSLSVSTKRPNQKPLSPPLPPPIAPHIKREKGISLSLGFKRKKKVGWGIDQGRRSAFALSQIQKLHRFGVFFPHSLSFSLPHSLNSTQKNEVHIPLLCSFHVPAALSQAQSTRKPMFPPPRVP
jgi:hypothetical protein